MDGESGEVLREVTVGDFDYQIRRGGGLGQIETWWRVGWTDNGSLKWHPRFGLYTPGTPGYHIMELEPILTEMRAAHSRASIQRQREEWERRTGR